MTQGLIRTLFSQNFIYEPKTRKNPNFFQLLFFIKLIKMIKLTQKNKWDNVLSRGGELTSHEGYNKGYEEGGKVLKNVVLSFVRKAPKKRVGRVRSTKRKRGGTSNLQ